MIVVLVSLAFAADPAPVGERPPVGEMPPADAIPAEVTPAPTDELIAEAWRRIDLRDYEGARIVASQARDREDAAYVRATVALGAAYELDSDPARALALYESARSRELDAEMSDHVTFRVAECQAQLLRYDEALATLATLGDPELRPYLDGRKIHILRGVWLVESGAREDGLAELAVGLDGIGTDEVTWYQARARAAIAKDLCAQASAIPLSPKQRGLVRALKARTELILAAEDQVSTALRLQEPEWGLEGLLTLSLTYERVGDDMLTLPPPKKLRDDEQRALYAEVVRERVVALYVKASRYAGDGVDAATRLSFRGKQVEALRVTRDRLVAKASG